MSRIVLQPGFVLHTRPYRDSSLLVNLLTLRYGRIDAVARGVRSSKSKTRGLLLPFVPLLLSWSGKSELVTLGNVEAAGAAYYLSGDGLLSGIYLNELLMKLLQRHDPHAQLYLSYQDSLRKLQIGSGIQAALRVFERILLTELGYGLELRRDVEGRAVISDAFYRYQHEHGFVRCEQQLDDSMIFSGRNLLLLADSSLDAPDDLLAAKRLMRMVLAQLLAGKTLRSRELYNSGT